MAQAPIRIVIVDDHALLAESLGAWIIRQPDLVLAGRAEDGETGYNLCLALKPDLALLDIDLPKIDGLELIRRFVVEMPAMRLLTMSGRMDPYTIWRVSQSGGHGYVEKTANPEILAKAIYAIAGGGTYFSELFQKIKGEWLGQPEAFQKILSDREQEVLRRVVTGDSDEQIAAQLGISVATIGVHRKHIRQKLELHNDRELVAYARKWGLDQD
ncbi:MAG TPA: response regulator transcription factor [Candidatus Sulfotelmatobacter sp.]|jgi:DNA-binding NarL/FixJ family response regulator|nr:response regulator transcription factor [Candidatus Sulfotelmatobacter sp.]